MWFNKRQVHKTCHISHFTSVTTVACPACVLLSPQETLIEQCHLSLAALQPRSHHSMLHPPPHPPLSYPPPLLSPQNPHRSQWRWRKQLPSVGPHGKSLVSVYTLTPVFLHSSRSDSHGFQTLASTEFKPGFASNRVHVSS